MLGLNSSPWIRLSDPQPANPFWLLLGTLVTGLYCELHSSLDPESESEACATVLDLFLLFIGWGGGFEYLEILMGYSWHYTQESLIVILWGPYGMHRNRP